MEGITVRFCQQCAKFEPLDKFDHDRRTCRAKLLKHNAQRREKRLRNKETLLEQESDSPKKKSKPLPPRAPVERLPLPPSPISPLQPTIASDAPRPARRKRRTNRQEKAQNDSKDKNNTHVPSFSEFIEDFQQQHDDERVRPRRSQRQASLSTQNRGEDSAFNIVRAASLGSDIFNIANFDIPNFDWQAGLPNHQPLLPFPSLPDPLSIEDIDSRPPSLVNIERAPSWANINVIGVPLPLDVLDGLAAGPSSAAFHAAPAQQQRQKSPLPGPPQTQFPQQQQVPTTQQIIVPSAPQVHNTRLIAASFQLFQVPPNLLPAPVLSDLEEFVGKPP